MSMLCPFCNYPSKVYNTLLLANEVARIRMCIKCNKRWRTYEYSDLSKKVEMRNKKKPIQKKRT